MNLKILNSLDGQKKILYLSVGTVLIIVLTFYFAILPLVDKIKNTRLEIINTKIEIVNNKDKEKNITKLNNIISNIEPKLDQFENIYVKSNRELEFITGLESAAKNNGVSQSIKINPSSNPTDGKLSKNPITLDVTGAYNNLYKYLIALENSNYYINIRALELINSNSSPSEEENLLQLTIQADTYWK